MKERFGLGVQQHQLLNLLALILLAKQLDLFYLSWAQFAIVLLAAVCVEQMALYTKGVKFHFSYSAVITAIGVTLMMASSHVWIYGVVVSAGLLQKHVFTIGGRHFFNPSNFALLMAMLFFYDEAHIVLGQLGDNRQVMGMVGLLALLILWRVNRWLIPLVFTVSYILLEYFFVIRPDPVMTFEIQQYRFVSVSFVVFIVFMLTDPRTTPALRCYQMGFAVCVALGAVILDYMQGFRVQHLFLSLAFCSPWVVLAELWKIKPQRGVLIGAGLVMIVCVVGAISWVEMKPPYYFSMEG